MAGYVLVYPAIVASGGVVFVWDAVGGATSYVFRLGTSSGGTQVVDDLNVGNVLTYSVALGAGTYYANVQAQPAGTWAGEQSVTV